MRLFILFLYLSTVNASAKNEECSLNVCHTLNTFREELKLIEKQILGHEEDTEFKKLERRLRSLEQTSKSHPLQLNNKIVINFVIISLDHFVC